VTALQSASGSQAGDPWTPVREFPAEVARRNAEGLMLRVGCEPKKLGEVFRLVRDTAGETPMLARAANGVSYIACSILDEAVRCLKACREAGLAAVVESAPEHQKMSIKLWDGSGTQFQVMERVKSQFDPWHLLNPGRLFNLI
jgi:FAD/FMN-containing dehydrogenase